MKFKHLILSRRKFLNGLIGGGIGALLASFVYPIVRFIFPPYKEPDKVILPLSDYIGLEKGSVKTFPWGSKPGILKKNDDGSLMAFVAVCTHLDCNVTYLQEEKKFFCACHDGWYDEFGVNIGGPPSKPLRQLIVEVGAENLIIKREGVE